MGSSTVPTWLFLLALAFILLLLGATSWGFWLVTAAAGVLVFKVFSW